MKDFLDNLGNLFIDTLPLLPVLVLIIGILLALISY
jgi:hypothetical protein